MGLFSKKAPTPAPFTPTTPYGSHPAWMLRQDMDVTLWEGTESLEVVGESHYQEALWSIVGGNKGSEVRVPVYSLLVAEEGNPYDANAIAIYAQGLLVGYLSRSDAKDIRPALLRNQIKTGKPAALGGVIVGGGPVKRFLGIWLTWDPDDWDADEVDAEEEFETPRVEQPAPVDLSAFDQPTDTNAPADWYADPHGLARLRYWTGTAWSEHTHD